MKLKNLTLIFASLLAVFLLTGLGSAVTADPDPDEINITHGNTGTVSFEVSAVSEWNFYNMTMSATDLGPINSGNISISSDPTPISNGTNDTVKVDIKIPKHTSEGHYSSILTIDGHEQNATNSSDYRPMEGPKPEVEIKVYVPENSSLKFTKTSDFDEGENTTKVTIKNNGNTDLSGINLTSSGDFDVNFSENNFDLENADEEREKEITVTLLDDIDDLDLGENEVKIKATADDEDETNADTTLIYDKLFSEEDNEGDLEIPKKRFKRRMSVEKGFGEDEEWYPLDEIQLDFMVRNDGDWDIDDIEIEVCLFDVEEKRCIMDERDMEIDNDDFDLRGRGTQDVEIDFKIDPYELYFENEEYEVHVKATGEIDDSDSDYDGDLTGTSLYEEVEILQEEFIVVDDLRVSSPSGQDSYNCGSEVEIKGDVWNIGDREIDSDEAYLRVYNEDLGINEVIDLENIHALDSLPLDLTFEIPEGIDEEYYELEFIAYDDEDVKDNDIYELDDKEAIYSLFLDVEGQCSIPEAEISETVLKSGEYVGETFVINTKLTNKGEDTTNYTLTASDYSEWASSVSFSDQLFSLQPGESKDIQIELQIKEEVSGNETFNMEVYSGDELVTKQPIQVPVKESEELFDLSGINLITVLAIAISVILIAIVVVLVLRVSEKESSSKE